MSGPTARGRRGQDDAVELLERLANLREHDGQLAEHAGRLRALAGEEKRHGLRPTTPALACKKMPRGSSRLVLPCGDRRSRQRSFSRKSSCEAATIARRASAARAVPAARFPRLEERVRRGRRDAGRAPPSSAWPSSSSCATSPAGRFGLPDATAPPANRGSRPTGRSRRCGRRPRGRRGSWCRRSRRR